MRPCAKTLDSEITPSEQSLLLHTIKSKQFPGKHLEIGTAAGGTLWRMMSCFENQSRPPFVVIDPMSYFPNQQQVVSNNLKDHGIDPSTVDFRTTTSDAAFKEAEASGEKFDFIFIDGAHKIKYVMQDLRFSRLLNAGGVLMMHDYTQNHPGVVLAANRFLRKNRNYIINSQADSLLSIEKISESTSDEAGTLDQAFALLLSPLLQIEMAIRKRRDKRRRRREKRSEKV